jgi:hypothetical protein
MVSPFPSQGKGKGVHALSIKVTIPKSNFYEEFGGVKRG